MLSIPALVLATLVATPLAPTDTPEASWDLPTPTEWVVSLDASTPVRDSLTHYYVRRDTRAVRRLHRIARTRGDKLLVRYRLFPMTMDEGLLRSIPSDQGVRSARELALISAMWAYKAANGPKINLPTHGRRSERILNQAKEINPNDPYVLLVQGQSLLYKPGIFGGDVGEAKATFQKLKRIMRGRSVPGLHAFEADVWIWMCERKLDRGRANTLKQQLLRRNPPPMFRQFLIDPP